MEASTSLSSMTLNPHHTSCLPLSKIPFKPHNVVIFVTFHSPLRTTLPDRPIEPSEDPPVADDHPNLRKILSNSMLENILVTLQGFHTCLGLIRLSHGSAFLNLRSPEYFRVRFRRVSYSVLRASSKLFGDMWTPSLSALIITLLSPETLSQPIGKSSRNQSSKPFLWFDLWTSNVVVGVLNVFHK